MKNATLVAAVALVLPLAGCSSDDPAARATATPSPSVSASAAPVAVGPTAVPTAVPSAAGGAALDPVPRVTLAAGQASGQPCSVVTGLSERPKVTRPADLVLVPGAEVFLTKGTEYRYPVLYASLAMSPPDVSAARDLAVRTLEKAGYTLTSSDQEPNVEATAALQNARRKVNVQVIQLCQGKVRVRYTPIGNQP